MDLDTASRASRRSLLLLGAGALLAPMTAAAAAPPGTALARLIVDRAAAEAEFLPWRDGFSVGDDCQVLVNATSVGLAPAVDARLALDLASLRPGLIVADVVPNPPRTALLREAEARGCTTLDGLGMLVEQAVAGIGLWTGLVPDRGVMRATLERALARR